MIFLDRPFVLWDNPPMTTTQTWEAEQIAKLNALADDTTAGPSREAFADIGGIFWLMIITDGNERVNKRYKCARSALKAFFREGARYSVIPNLIPKTSGRVALYVRRSTVLENTWREHAKMWI
jgi:hypothetical protein